MIITLEKYLTSNGRHPEVMKEWDGTYEKNALKTIATVSEFSSLAGFVISDITSGWRTSWLNRNVGGSTSSKHLFAQAIDVSDPDRLFGQWLSNNVALLRSRNCAIESLATTHAAEDPLKRWVHFQIVIPASNHVIFSV
jgi:hypothetical protein